ncbi:FlgK family flagellar hook-associated protein [Aquicella lusitana]|uniref:Flagellar hook-associated protein 1 n=1 Tax=Aquicella lusitana TaxID=254246 RepID=A0A370G840_9COXI|nr:flagellar basal body protein [Aquicella lusitana]RDI39962.1 flagellar hook-associated protein 1 FlgK [Aquicella lusitana]VVC74565.1 Flagellar hook-associated protein 1 [Aquicella lusitana]
MSDIMRIGISALMAYQSALNVASQNIANADTPYFSRREINFTEFPFDSGVNVSDVRRIVDETANRYAQISNSDYSKWSVYLQQLGNFEPLFDDNTTNIGKFITDTLGALQQIENNFNPNNRALFMSKLAALSQQFQNINGEINRQTQNVSLSLQTEVKQVNNLLGSLAEINREITGSGGVERPDLLDQREALVQELAKYLNFTASVDQNGKLDISLSNGMSLLSSNPPVEFVTLTDPANPTNLNIGVKNGTTTIDVTQLITSGEIAGWINYRTNGLAAAQAALGRLALAFSDKLNTQNKLGIDGNGNLGGNIFANINTASAMANRVIANSNNAGSASMTVNIDDTSQLTTSDYRLSIGASNTYVLTRLSDNTVVSSGTISSFPQAVTVDGFTINVNSGTLSAGDQYLISPTYGAANNLALAITDPSQLALGWPVTASEGTKQPGSNGTIEVKDITDTTTSDFSIPKQLNPPIEIRFTSSGGIVQYSLYNATTSTLIEGPITYDPTSGANIFPTPANYDPGYRVSISGNNIQDGDTFNIAYNTNSASDNRNARTMVQLYQQGSLLGADGRLITFNQGYNLLASDVSVKTNEAAARYETSARVREQAEERRDRISGVSLEEEALNLARYQTAYQASAQVLEIAKSVFDTIIAITRG